MEVTEADSSDTAEPCRIPLRDVKGNVVDYALVSPEDYERVSQHKWHRQKNGNGGFHASGGPGNHWLLHHFIAGRPEQEGEVVDHRNNNGLDNVKENLRKITYSGNSQNTAKRENTSSKYKNVCFNSARSKWVVSVKKVQYGLFPEDEEEAAGKLADRAILSVYGAEARTNGLLTQEEISDVLTGNDPQPASKASGLPKGVTYRKDQDKYRATLRFEGQTYQLGSYHFQDEAEDAYNTKLDELREQKWQKHLQKPIQRNDDGIAVIDITDKTGAIVAQSQVDDEVWHKLTTSSWNLSDGYAVGTIDQKFVKMHRYLVEGKKIMHINGNNLDNRRRNLKDAALSEINQHFKKKAGLSSKYKGVSFNKKRKLWEVEVRKDGQRYKLGAYTDEDEAARAYNEKAADLFVEPYLNQID